MPSARKIRLLLLILALPVATAAVAETKLLRFPDVHDDRVVFSYGGDLWTAPVSGGTARRLTSHPGLELFAKFSPDGRWIAFTGQYGGDEQVYVMPANGGEPRQLTWYPASGPLPARWGYDHQVYGWSADGQRVLFRSRRDAWGSSTATLYTVAVAGGLPSRLPVPVAGAGTFSADGSALLYSPLFRDFRTWKRYQGGWAQDLWIYDFDRGQARQLTNHPRTERDPMWIGEFAYFVSDRSGKLNLYRIDPDSGESTALTAHQDFDVRWASADTDGRIVYELNGRLRLFDTRDQSDHEVNITVPDDSIHSRPRWVKVDDQINAARLSPTGQRVVFEARGNLFNAPVGDGATRNLTDRSTAHDREAGWSADGQRVAFISDSSGEEELYIIAADGRGAAEQLTQGNTTRFYAPRFSPDGDHIALSDKDGRILVIRADGRGGLKEVGRDPSWRNRDYVWSPQGDLLAFSQTEQSGLRALYLHSIKDQRTRRISDGLFSEYQPSFSADGKWLYFLGDREFAPQISQREWNYAVNRMTGIFAFALTTDTDHPFAPKDAVEHGLNGLANEQDAEGKNSKPGNSKADGIEVDYAGMAERLLRVPVEPGNIQAMAVVDAGVLFVETDAFYYGRSGASEAKLRLFKFEDQKVVDFPSGLQVADLSADGKRLLVRRGGNWQVLDVAKEGRDGEDVAVKGLRAMIDPAAEWATAFEEVWRRFRDFFYVSNMHGYDWDVLREQYRPLLEHVAHRSDLNYVMGEMIAELNISHAYVSGGDEGLPERFPVALLGARFEIDNGRYRVAEILSGQNDEPRYRSPLTEAGVAVSPGDYLLAINGRDLSADENIYQRLLLPPEEVVVLTLSERADGKESREALVRPIGDESPLHYLAWVRANLDRVSKASGGRVGYLHIPDMGANGIREFIKWFYGQRHKPGLVIDVRSNGGGNVSQMLIERLSRRPLALGYSRTMPDATTYPNQAVNAHMVALLDENSASDGDIFPWQFRNAGLGPLIGKRSWGGVTGITNHGPLIDGGQVNVPEFGFADINGNYVIEGDGVIPDIEVENHPDSVLAGEDRQLERAIDEVLRRLEADPRDYPEQPEAPVKLD